MKIYFACSIRGENDSLEDKKLIVQTMKDLGHTVLSEIFAGDVLNEQKVKKMTDQQIYQRDMNWIKEADAVVACLATSYGMGYEIGWADRDGKKIIALLKGENKNFSAMGLGNTSKNFKLISWQTKEDVQKIMKKELGRAD